MITHYLTIPFQMIHLIFFIFITDLYHNCFSPPYLLFTPSSLQLQPSSWILFFVFSHEIQVWYNSKNQVKRIQFIIRFWILWAYSRTINSIAAGALTQKLWPDTLFPCDGVHDNLWEITEIKCHEQKTFSCLFNIKHKGLLLTWNFFPGEGNKMIMEMMMKIKKEDGRWMRNRKDEKMTCNLRNQAILIMTWVDSSSSYLCNQVGWTHRIFQNVSGSPNKKYNFLNYFMWIHHFKTYMWASVIHNATTSLDSYENFFLISHYSSLGLLEEKRCLSWKIWECNYSHCKYRLYKFTLYKAATAAPLSQRLIAGDTSED